MTRAPREHTDCAPEITGGWRPPQLLLKALREEGVEVDPHREDYDYGPFAWIMDPEGNRIELGSRRLESERLGENHDRSNGSGGAAN